jgi:hypothetical protein
MKQGTEPLQHDVWPFHVITLQLRADTSKQCAEDETSYEITIP